MGRSTKIMHIIRYVVFKAWILKRDFTSPYAFSASLSPYRFPHFVSTASSVTFTHALPVPIRTYIRIRDAIFQWLGNPRGTDLKLRS